ncbi:hypothetical protein J7384_17930 [Endozoicomonas sp. G2_1]|nr:hypothetical protein [Endozoicomonas sp. G2_1]MBO9492246.1 hypothetical protein [Endozoicomonas sp. G2_1]
MNEEQKKKAVFALMFYVNQNLTASEAIEIIEAIEAGKVPFISAETSQK